MKKVVFTFVITVVALILTISSFADAGEEIVGYTEDGFAITKKDVEVKTLRINDIDTFKYIDDKDVLRITTKRDKRTIEVHFFGTCFEFKNGVLLGIGFANQMSTSFITRGDKMYPVPGKNSIGCIIDRMYEVIPVDKNG